MEDIIYGKSGRPPEEDLTPIARLNADLKAASRILSLAEVRFLVQCYYRWQEERIRSSAQVRRFEKTDPPTPHMLLDWVADQSETLESQVRRALGYYAASDTVGNWLMSICGIGPVLASGFLAHLELNRPRSVSELWSFAGFNPTVVWEKGQKRPWNAALKTLCYKAGESFVTRQNHPEDVYGKHFVFAKRREWGRNLSGANAEYCAQRKTKYSKDTLAWRFLSACYSADEVKTAIEKGTLAQFMTKKGEVGAGTAMIPPAQVHARARRTAVKLFLSHVYDAMHVAKFGRRVLRPYAFAQLEHTGYIEAPNMHLIEGWATAPEAGMSD